MWVGIDDKEVEGVYKFIDGKDVTSNIKHHGDKTPFDDDDLFIRWMHLEPSGEPEDYVEMFLNNGWRRYTFNDLSGDVINRHAMCEKADPHCIKGFSYLLKILYFSV